MTTLTKENAKTGIKLKSKSSPEWGTWVLTLDEVNGHHSIKASHGERCLFEDEFKFWEVLN